MTSLLIGALLLDKTMPILFFGNSHTVGNDCARMVRNLLQSDGSGRKVVMEVRQAGFLEEFAAIDSNLQLVKSRKWSAIVMQGLKLSSSHKYVYDHTGAVTLAKLARQHSAKPLFLAEWPRKGWDETEWIIGQYQSTSKASGVPIAPVGRAWKPVLREFPKLELWHSDGNHASVTGSYLAACGLYYALVGTKGKPTWAPKEIDAKMAGRLREHARSAQS